VHNHYHYGSAFVDSLHDFAKGQRVYDNYLSSCKNPPLVRIQNALDQVIAGQPYDVLSYNCQTTVNMACNNEQKSQSVEGWQVAARVGVFGLFIGGLVYVLSSDR
jgi:hypothetical protein